MIGPSGSKGRTGAAAGLLGPPPRRCRTFCSNIGRLTATGRVADAPIPASPGRSGICLRNPAARIDGACDGQPTMVEARRRMCARGIRGRCSRTEEMFRCQWPSGAGYHHGPAGKDVERLDYRTETGVDQSERKPGRRNASNDGRATGANHADVALTGAAVAVGTWEKREVTGVSRLAPLLKCTSHLGFSLGLGERAGNVLHPDH